MKGKKRLGGTAVYRQHPAVAVEDFGDRSLVLHCEDLRLVELNTTSRDLLSRLDGQATLDEVIRQMAGDYDLPAKVLREDVEAVIAQLIVLGLVEQVGA